MSESLFESLSEIRKLTPDLNKVTDEAAHVVSLVEKMLVDTGVGIATTVDAGSISGNDLKLGYQRCGGRFRIVVEMWASIYDEHRDEENYEKLWEKAWTDVPRTEKLCSFKALPKLLSQIASEEKRAVQEMSGTAETIKAVMAAIRG